jgi:hypothetical protein
MAIPVTAVLFGVVFSGKYWTFEKLTLLFCLLNLVYVPAALWTMEMPTAPAWSKVFDGFFMPHTMGGGFSVYLLFIVLAFYYVKHTRNGYRLDFAKVVFLNLVLSFAGGAVLYSLGAGREAESELAKRAPFYNDLRNSGQEAVWLRPEQGVIVGRVVEIGEDGEMLEVDDPHRVIWTVNASEAEYFQGFVVQEGFMIKVFGQRCEGDNCFIAKEIRPLLRERGLRMDEMRPSRDDMGPVMEIEVRP